jgi:hypothetical protein
MFRILGKLHLCFYIYSFILRPLENKFILSFLNSFSNSFQLILIFKFERNFLVCILFKTTSRNHYIFHCELLFKKIPAYFTASWAVLAIFLFTIYFSYVLSKSTPFFYCVIFKNVVCCLLILEK